MDSGLARAVVGAALVAGLAIAAWEAPAQLTDQPPLGPPPAGPPPSDGSPPQPASGPDFPVGVAPPPVVANMTPPTNATNATNAAASAPAAPTAPPVAKPPPPPPEPPPPPRAPTAVMQVLDKVTAETLQFEAPIGRPIRYKTLVLTVRVCETRGAGDPQPRPSAYVEMDTRAPSLPDHEPPEPKRVFEGWMFANAPALHPLEHPIYDAWLVSCSAGTPVVRPPPAPAAVVPAKPPAVKPPAAPAPVSVPAKKPPTVKAPVAKPPSPPPPVSVPENAPADNSSTPPQ